MRPFKFLAMTSSSKMKYQFLAELVFGMPSRKCKNFGICNINPIRHQEAATKKNNGDALAIITVVDSHFAELDLFCNTISASVYQKFLGNGNFLVEEDYCFSQLPDKNYHFTIRKGSYPIFESTQLIKIVCRIPSPLEIKMMSVPK